MVHMELSLHDIDVNVINELALLLTRAKCPSIVKVSEHINEAIETIKSRPYFTPEFVTVFNHLLLLCDDGSVPLLHLFVVFAVYQNINIDRSSAIIKNTRDPAAEHVM